MMGKQNESDFKNSTFERKNNIEGSGGGGMEENGAEEDNQFVQGQQNPKDQESLDVNEEIKDLFKQVAMYKPQTVDLETKIKPFIPD